MPVKHPATDLKQWRQVLMLSVIHYTSKAHQTYIKK